MDADRFDALARILTTAGSRRALTFALGGFLALLVLERPDDTTAAKSGKCKQPCGPCARCKEGKCKHTAHGKRCKAGKCKPKRNGKSCPQFGTCRGGKCRVPFCSGKNYCPITGTPPQCQASGPECLCFVTSTGAPFCALTSSLQQAASCGACPLQSHTCLNLAGCPVAVGEVGCGTPCPTPL
jgi:hypothetical protein